MSGQDPFNPVLRSERDVEAFRASCQGLLQRSWTPQGPRFGLDERCAALFLQFTERAQGDRISLAESRLRVRIDAKVPMNRDEAVLDCVRKAWKDAAAGFSEQTGLSLPQGQIYVWILPDTQELIEKWHLDPGIGAATFMGRYVAVPLSSYQVYAPGRVLPFTGLSFRRLEADLRHEFTHAFFIGLTGREALAIPSWFLEGMAVTVAKNVPAELTRDYAYFGRAFRKCRQAAGEEAFQAFCQALTEGSEFDELLLETTGYLSYERLLQEMRRRDRMKWTVFLAVLAGFFLRSALLRRRRDKRFGSSRMYTDNPTQKYDENEGGWG